MRSSACPFARHDIINLFAFHFTCFAGCVRSTPLMLGNNNNAQLWPDPAGRLRRDCRALFYEQNLGWMGASME
jgi:hypothetical protein